MHIFTSPAIWNLTTEKEEKQRELTLILLLVEFVWKKSFLAKIEQFDFAHFLHKGKYLQRKLQMHPKQFFTA